MNVLNLLTNVLILIQTIIIKEEAHIWAKVPSSSFEVQTKGESFLIFLLRIPINEGLAKKSVYQLSDKAVKRPRYFYLS